MKYRLMVLVIALVSMLGAVGRVAANPADSGMVAPQIVGGSIVTANSLPWQALLQIGGYMCGGSLIDEEWVLTASHCVEGMTAGQAKVYLGLHDSNTLTTAANPYLQSKTVSQIIMHASYNASTTDYDIALLKLASPANLTTGVQIIPLATTANNSALYTAGTSLTVSGWGTTSSGGATSRYLRKVNVPVVANASCNTMYGGGITARMMCAGDTVNGGEDSCQGDSGGPLIGQQNGSYVQVGVVSWGNGCAEAAYPGVYTNVANLHAWVAAQVPLADTPVVTATPVSTSVATATAAPVNPTSTKVPTKTAVPTQTKVPTKTATPMPSWTNNVINGSFEAGSDGSWVEFSSNYPNIIDNDTRVKPRSGLYYAWLGGASDEVSELSQTFTVPAAAPYLRIYYMAKSSETCGTYQDSANVMIDDKVVSQFDLCAKRNVNTWKPLTIDLSAYTGAEVTLMVSVSTDSDTKYSSFWVDDVGFVQSKSQVLNYYRAGSGRASGPLPTTR